MIAAALVISLGSSAVVHSRATNARLTTFDVHPIHASGANAAPPQTAWCEANWHYACYQPAQIQAAYDLNPLYRSTNVAGGYQGQGQTIVIVDSYGSPTIASDLAKFDAAFSLPAPPSFKVISPAGAPPKFNASNPDVVGWAGETTLDVEWSHVIAPKASILLVTTPSDEIEGTSGFADIVKAENYVVTKKLGNVISQSFGATEQTFTGASALNPFRSAYVAAQAAGVTVLAATGDSGATDVGSDAVTYFAKPVVDWPASDPLVTAVGGTELSLNPQGARTTPDVAWNDTLNTAIASGAPLATGGGLSTFFSRPSYQASLTVGSPSARSIPDVAMSAACSGQVDVYESFPGRAGSWSTACGTSEATPMFAGIVALADQVAGHGLGLINPALYKLESKQSPGIIDITSGNNTVSFNSTIHSVPTTTTVTGYEAQPGYDLVSGVGTVDAGLFVPALAAAGS